MLSKRRPALMKRLLRKGIERQLPKGYDIDTHFTPRYNPWDQRLCLVPNGDLFKAIKQGTASVVTDHIATFTETGIALRSGAHIDADIVVTATGLVLQIFGGMSLEVDGAPIVPSKVLVYKGMMCSGVPNLAFASGYTNASWTLKADLVSRYVCRVLNRMRRSGARIVMPRPADPAMARLPWVDFSSGYFQRSMAELPKQGAAAPWKLNQNYLADIVALRWRGLDDGVLQFVA